MSPNQSPSYTFLDDNLDNLQPTPIATRLLTQSKPTSPSTSPLFPTAPSPQATQPTAEINQPNPTHAIPSTTVTTPPSNSINTSQPMNAPPTNPLPVTAPTHSHPMTTRGKSGISKPISRLNLHTSSVSPIPKSHIHALNDPNWQKAMTDEYGALIKNGTWSLVPRPADVNVVRSMWLFKHKYNADGSLR